MKDKLYKFLNRAFNATLALIFGSIAIAAILAMPALPFLYVYAIWFADIRLLL